MWACRHAGSIRQRCSSENEPMEYVAHRRAGGRVFVWAWLIVRGQRPYETHSAEWRRLRPTEASLRRSVLRRVLAAVSRRNEWRGTYSEWAVGSGQRVGRRPERRQPVRPIYMRSRLHAWALYCVTAPDHNHRWASGRGVAPEISLLQHPSRIAKFASNRAHHWAWRCLRTSGRVGMSSCPHAGRVKMPTCPH